MRLRAASPFAAVLAASTVAAASGAPLSHMPAPAPQPRTVDVARKNASCEGCHEDEAREWRGSMHAQSDVDPVYRRALAREPMPFCRKCHAPEADPAADAPRPLSSIGVSCVTCHVTGDGDAVLAAPLAAGAAPVAASAAPHAVVRDARFATPAACAGCHEFDFPDRSPGQHPERMQATISEHAASPASSTPCASCHMPAQGARRGHAFAASRDPAMLRAAVAASAARSTPTTITVRLAPAGAGHAFPTGDLFRRLVVSAEAVGDDWTVAAEASRPLHRRFAMEEITKGHVGRVLVGDDRVGVGGAARTVSLDLGEAARGRTIAWRVEYQRVEHPVGADDADDVVASSTTVADGRLPARR